MPIIFVGHYVHQGLNMRDHPLKYFLIYSVISLLPLRLYGESTTTAGTTPHGYNQEFCTKGASDQIDDLNKKTEVKINNIKKLQKDLNTLTAKSALLSGLKDIVKDYKTIISDIKNEGPILKTVSDSSIKNFKRLLNNALILQGVSVYAEENLAHPETKITNINGEEKINKVLNQFEVLLKTAGNSPDLNHQIHKLYRKIPSNIGPDEILKLIAEKSPSLKELVTNAPNLNEIKSCLAYQASEPVEYSPTPNEISFPPSPEVLKVRLATIQKNKNAMDACRKLMTNHDYRNQLGSIIKGEYSELKNYLKENAPDPIVTTVEKVEPKRTYDSNIGIDEIENDVAEDETPPVVPLGPATPNATTNKISQFKNDEYDDLMNKYDQKNEKKIKDLTDLLTSKRNDLKKLSETLYLKDHPNETNLDGKNGFAPSDIAPGDYQEALAQCQNFSDINDLKFKLIENCIKANEKIQKAYEKLDSYKNEIAKSINDLSNDGELVFYEKMKLFVQNRYLRSCSVQQNGKLATSNVCQIQNKLAIANESEIDNLRSTLASTIGLLQANRPTTEKGEVGLFSKAEINQYKNYCNETTYKTSCGVTCTNICNQINNESNAMSGKKESKEWADYNKKYIVTYNPHSKNGYDVRERKSNWKIFGEGAAQSVTSIIPIWLNDYQMTNQINMMTDQAIYQKQMNYLYTQANPWGMLPYFQGNNFGTMPQFNTTNPFLNNTGFNFSN